MKESEFIVKFKLFLDTINQAHQLIKSISKGLAKTESFNQVFIKTFTYKRFIHKEIPEYYWFEIEKIIQKYNVNLSNCITSLQREETMIYKELLKWNKKLEEESLKKKVAPPRKEAGGQRY